MIEERFSITRTDTWSELKIWNSADDWNRDKGLVLTLTLHKDGESSITLPEPKEDEYPKAKLTPRQMSALRNFLKDTE